MTNLNKLLTNSYETTIGCDPEVFFMKNDNIFPATGLIGGDKEFPRLCVGGAMQEDNVMAEFNTDPVTTYTEFSSKVQTVYNQIEEIAIINGCTIGEQASKNLHQITLDTCEAAKQFGCDPDFNAYTLKRNKTPNPESRLRTCAGHIHIGYETKGGHNLETSAYLTRYLDAYLGTFCVINDMDTRRMSRYGKAGAFRPKPYGTEYRVPSNFWVFKESLRKEVFIRTREGYVAAKLGYRIPADTVRAINLQDKQRCEEILSCLRR